MKAAVLLTAVILAGCTTTQPAPSQTYRPRGSDATVQIRGQVIREDRVLLYPGWTAQFFIGNQKVIEGELVKYGDGELSGEWNGKPVDALCRGERYPQRVTCTILIDNERAATLTF